MAETVEKAGWTARKNFEKQTAIFSSQKASCTLEKIKHFKSRKTAQLCGFCAFCLLLGGSTAVRHHLAKYKIQLAFLTASQRVGLYNLSPLYLFRHAEPKGGAPLWLFFYWFYYMDFYKRRWAAENCKGNLLYAKSIKPCRNVKKTTLQIPPLRCALPAVFRTVQQVQAFTGIILR